MRGGLGAAICCLPSFLWCPLGFPWGRSIVNERCSYGLDCEEVAWRRGAFLGLRMAMLPLILVDECFSSPYPSLHLCPGLSLHPVLRVMEPAPSAHTGRVRWRGKPWRKANEVHTRQHLHCCKAWRNWGGEPGPQLRFVGGLQGGSHLFSSFAIGLN